jgi:cytochrome c
MRKLIVWLAIIFSLFIGIVIYAHRQWGGGTGRDSWAVRGGEPQHGREPIVKYGCNACHVVDGIGKATGRVGPKLQDIDEQIYLAGVIPNTAENMVFWIMFPQEINPRSAMPNLDVTEQDARNIAAYLYENS